MAAAEFIQDLLSFEPAYGDDVALDRQLKSMRAGIEKANPAVLDNVSLDVRIRYSLSREYNLLMRCIAYRSLRTHPLVPPHT